MSAEDVLLFRSRGLKAAQIDTLRRLSENMPHQVPARIILIGYYFAKSREQRAGGIAADEWLECVLWLARHSPWVDTLRGPFGKIAALEYPIEFATLKSIWKSHINTTPSEARILTNAAAFFSIDDPRLSRELLRRATALDPNDDMIMMVLAQLRA